MPAASDDLTRLAAEAYIYGYPLVFDTAMVERCTTDGFGAIPAAPPNTFGHATEPATPRDDFVSINNDTLYSIAQLDLSDGPLFLHVPDTADAYYVLQFVDLWTNNFAYVGRRATGTAASTYLITPPHWIGSVPDATPVINAPTTRVSIVGRFACDGPDDAARVAGLQKQLTLSPLGAAGTLAGLPVPDREVREDLRFWEQLRVLMAAFPPAEPDRAYQRRFAPLGLLHSGASPYRDTPDGLADALHAGMAAGKAQVEAYGKDPESDPSGSRWIMSMHAFDYNLDHLGLGTVDSPQWKVADRTDSYLDRAWAARTGLWGNHAYEALYAQTFVDANGDTLDGNRAYTLTFSEPPPVEAFWSVTMYNVPDYYLVDNAINRYSIGDRTEGLVYGDDGSLTLHLQHGKPIEGEEANWLPTPSGAFRPMIRLYQPGAALLDGKYRLPDIVPVP